MLSADDFVFDYPSQLTQNTLLSNIYYRTLLSLFYGKALTKTVPFCFNCGASAVSTSNALYFRVLGLIMSNHDIELENRTMEGSSIKEDARVDVEKLVRGDDLLLNNDVVDYRWSGITVTVKDRATKQPKEILSNIDGCVKAGKTLFSLRSSCYYLQIGMETPSLHLTYGFDTQ